VAGRTDRLLHSSSNGFKCDAKRVEGLGRDALSFVDQADQDVLGADETVVELPGPFLRKDEHTSSPVSESFGQPETSVWRLLSDWGQAPRPKPSPTGVSVRQLIDVCDAPNPPAVRSECSTGVRSPEKPKRSRGPTGSIRPDRTRWRRWDSNPRPPACKYDRAAYLGERHGAYDLSSGAPGAV
jgi:hypothetical protein